MILANYNCPYKRILYLIALLLKFVMIIKHILTCTTRSRWKWAIIQADHCVCSVNAITRVTVNDIVLILLDSTGYWVNLSILYVWHGAIECSSSIWELIYKLPRFFRLKCVHIASRSFGISWTIELCTLILNWFNNKSINQLMHAGAMDRVPSSLHSIVSPPNWL